MIVAVFVVGKQMVEQVEQFSQKQRTREHIPLYHQVSDRLIDTIKEKKLKPGDSMPAATALASSLNVNYRTLKSALEVLQQKGIIQQEANKQAVVARNLLTKHKLLFVRWDSSALSVAIMEGIKRYASENNVDYCVIDAKQNYKNLTSAIVHSSKHFDGLILLPFENKICIEAVQEAIAKGTKVVFVDRYLKEVEVGSVTSDGFTGGYLATAHMIQAHNCPVHCIGSISAVSSCSDRTAGWREAMSEHFFMDFAKYRHEISCDEMDLAKHRNLGFQDSCEIALKILESEKGNKCCIFAINDYWARGVYWAAEKLGLQVGRDVFVVGFDNLPFCETMPVPLSSIKHDPQLIGYEAARILHHDLSGETEHPRHTILPVELVIRASSDSEFKRKNGEKNGFGQLAVG